MDNKVVVKSIDINKNKISYQYDVFGDIRKYFNLDKVFFIEYDEDISEVPKAVAIIPFILNVIPIIWINDATLVIDEIDETFYKSIPKFKKGYIDMYPELNFKGNIQVKEIIRSSYKKTNKCATFFSGGLDSFSTLINHIKEKPDLVTLWGSDIKLDDYKGWENVSKKVSDVANEYGLKAVFIKSSFREFINEGVLENEYNSKIKSGWWYGIQCGIGIIGHIAAYAWKYNLNSQYVASSECLDDGDKVRSGSYPTIDNNIKFLSCSIYHDQFLMSRQDKTKYIIDYCINNNKNVNLRVCWQSKGGGNCCKCEKCYRTICGFLVEGEDPNKYGFTFNKEVLKTMKGYLIGKGIFSKKELNKTWDRIKKRAIDNKSLIKQEWYFKDLKWILNFDFINVDRNWIILFNKIKISIKYRVSKIIRKE